MLKVSRMILAISTATGMLRRSIAKIFDTMRRVNAFVVLLFIFTPYFLFNQYCHKKQIPSDRIKSANSI